MRSASSPTVTAPMGPARAPHCRGDISDGTDKDDEDDENDDEDDEKGMHEKMAQRTLLDVNSLMASVCMPHAMGDSQ